MDDKVKIGLIGLGRMGRIYVEALTFRIPRAELVAVADINGEAAKKIAASYRIKHWFGGSHRCFYQRPYRDYCRRC